MSFLAVSRLESFTKAAVPLHVTQPAVSARIARLERDLGLSLLDRSTRPATLTRDGARLLPVADRLVRLLVEFREG